jgi:hypothetical protein
VKYFAGGHLESYGYLESQKENGGTDNVFERI